MKSYILGKILAEGRTELSKDDYSIIISVIDSGAHAEAMCKYILLCAREACFKEFGYISLAQVYKKLNGRFCALKANEYVIFLQNCHEHLDEIETFKK